MNTPFSLKLVLFLTVSCKLYTCTYAEKISDKEKIEQAEKRFEEERKRWEEERKRWEEERKQWEKGICSLLRDILFRTIVHVYEQG